MWWLIVALGLILLPTSLAAQSPCEDRVRELAVYTDVLGRARTRAELDGAKAIADLLKEREELRKEVERLTKTKEGR
ncbi:MAG TPA: hypothetical protein DCQ64_19190 [Candidatus Rokubacteria bacterium]|nr:hypothetical protein [Candidatus Rokubacteria bacterium]